MKEIALPSWEAFQDQVQQLRQLPRAQNSPPLLFRGQSDASWRLETTLERAGKKDMLFSQYFDAISRAKPEIETFFGVAWEAPSLVETHQRLLHPIGPILDPAVYRYMLHLRHYGFPSPMLDWTRSPYVAAYFAFRQQAFAPNGECAIYAYSETPKGVKAGRGGESSIIMPSVEVRGLPRHFLQQSEYSMCCVFEDEWRFACHEEVFDRGHIHQDVLWKLIIPSSERARVIGLLDEHNLNAYSLFGSEESLMETMASRYLA